jgi:hypothetical protein
VPPLPPGVNLPVFTLPLAANTSALGKKLKLINKEREAAEPAIITFGQTVYHAKHKQYICQN